MTLCQFHITEIDGVLVCTKCKREQRSKYGPERTYRECRIDEAKQESTNCKHRLAELRREQCSTCAGSVQVKVFQCSLHGECTLVKKIPGIHACQNCKDKS